MVVGGIHLRLSEVRAPAVTLAAPAWAPVRNAIRCNDHGTLDWPWRYFAPLFRAANKNQYASYGVQQATAVRMMCPSVRAV